MDGMLSQDEINALLAGVSGSDNADNSARQENENKPSTEEQLVLSDSEKDAVGEISNISMGTAATTLSSLLNQRVDITTPSVSVATWDELSVKYDRPCVMLQISYREGIDGNNVLILKERDVKIITDLMMGGEGQVNDDEPLSELHLSAIGEAMNQMMGSAATSMSSMFNRKIDISPPIANMIETYSEPIENLPVFLSGEFVMVAFKMKIGDLIDSEIMQLYPIEFAKKLLGLFAPSDEPEQQNTAPQTASQQPAQQPVSQQQPQQAAPDNSVNAQQNAAPQGQQMQGMPYGYPPMGMPYGYPPMGMPQGQPMAYGYAPNQQTAQQDVNVAPASFQPFSGDINALSQKENIDLIMDVPLEVTVELGRTKKSIKDILEFAPGTIVELNKIAGEAIDVLVNGKYVAKGEVVVIEESFGVRITEIIKDK